jgi:hypothetical protein
MKATAVTAVPTSRLCLFRVRKDGRLRLGLRACSVADHGSGAQTRNERALQNVCDLIPADELLVLNRAVKMRNRNLTTSCI